MTKEKIIQQVRNLHKSNIIIAKKEGLFGRQKFSLVVNEDGQTRKILQAHYKGGFWNTGCYKIVADSSIATTTITQETGILLTKTTENLTMAGDLTTTTTTINTNTNIRENEDDENNGAGELIRHNSHSHSSSSSSNLFTQSSNSNSNSHNNNVEEFETESSLSKTFNMFKKLKKRKLEDCNYVNVGKIESSGLFFDTTIIHDDKGESKGVVTYESTSRTGELMRLKIALPLVYKEPIENVARSIALCANIPKDLGYLIAGYVGNVYWSKGFNNLKLSNCHKLLKDDAQNVMKFSNKMPSWNPAIAAYTLEFCGRAILPSVHNFQLIDEEDNVVLQLGKVNETTFNMDFGYPLSAYQAFAVCLSVIVRTFVWD